MSRRLRRPTAALCALLLVPALAACGSDDADNADGASSSASPTASSSGSADAAGEVDGITFTGEVGEGITAEWTAPVEAEAGAEPTATTVVAGDGDVVTAGDTVSAYLWLGDGATQEQVFNGYDNGAPQAIPYDPEQLDAVFRSLLEGQTYGSRVATVTVASAVLGEGENQLGVDPASSVVVVADLVEKQQVSPTPTSDTVEEVDPGQQPTVVEEGGSPTGLDFSGIAEPALDAPVQRVVLQEGDGAPVQASDTVTVNYLGSTYDADAPFDESYSRGEPLTSPLSGLIQGWTIGLTGVTVGSRVLLQIPPAFGYGAQGSGDAIPGNSTLWFVIDVVSVG